MNEKMPLLQEMLKYHGEKNLLLSMPGNKGGIGFLGDDIGEEFVNRLNNLSTIIIREEPNL